mmetsp:Transcript_19869/g.43169  ORF Transcript_19869/g.43169 Transcript_19869/m.43169 type:complete len:226 (-) Transcript_19869:1-678(-)
MRAATLPPEGRAEPEAEPETEARAEGEGEVGCEERAGRVCHCCAPTCCTHGSRTAATSASTCTPAPVPASATASLERELFVMLKLSLSGGRSCESRLRLWLLSWRVSPDTATDLGDTCRRAGTAAAAGGSLHSTSTCRHSSCPALAAACSAESPAKLGSAALALCAGRRSRQDSSLWLPESAHRCTAELPPASTAPAAAASASAPSAPVPPPAPPLVHVERQRQR